MRTSQTTTTLTCDKCVQVVTHLNGLYVYDERGSGRSSDPHRLWVDLCDDCFAALIVFLGPVSFEQMNRLRKEANMYRDLDR